MSKTGMIHKLATINHKTPGTLKTILLVTGIWLMVAGCSTDRSGKQTPKPTVKPYEINALATMPVDSKRILVADQALLEVQRAQITIWDKKEKERLAVAPADWLVPELNGTIPEATVNNLEFLKDKIIYHFTDTDFFRDFRMTITVKKGYFELSAEFTPKNDAELNKLHVFPESTLWNMYEAVNIRNRQGRVQAWPRLLLEDEGFETSTNSTDWQFAPHPSMITFTKDNAQLFVGALDIPKSYGLYVGIEDYKTRHFYLNYGDEGFGRQLQAGKPFKSPRFCLFLNHTGDFYHTIDRYTGFLIRDGFIPDPAGKKRHAWHRQNLYCTWVDQYFLSSSEFITILAEQEENNPTAISVLDEKVIRKAASIIKEQDLPFRTILIDDGWFISRGEWVPHPERFPNFRQLVDDLHAMGFKVIIWWNWAELNDDAQADPDHLIADGKRNIHGKRMRDYSHPKTQEEYLKPLFRKFFSDEPGCYHVDGIKNDFQADKVHPEMPVYNQEWRGEENYFYRLYELFYGLMKQYKPSACHMGCSGHPYLAEFIDINRTYDVMNSDVNQHLSRAQMLHHTSVGTPVALDFHTYLENLDRYFALAKQHNYSVQIGNIMGIRQDQASEWHPAGNPYYDFLRKELMEIRPPVDQ